jgi:hypothetical protein
VIVSGDPVVIGLVLPREMPPVEKATWLTPGDVAEVAKPTVDVTPEGTFKETSKGIIEVPEYPNKERFWTRINWGFVASLMACGAPVEVTTLE